jgi:hypothetical protein
MADSAGDKTVTLRYLGAGERIEPGDLIHGSPVPEDWFWSFPTAEPVMRPTERAGEAPREKGGEIGDLFDFFGV